MATQQDTFEDAPDSASARSLTRRRPSNQRPVSESNQSELDAVFKKLKGKAAARASQKGGEPHHAHDSPAASSAVAEEHENKEAQSPTGSQIHAQASPPPSAGSDSKRKSSLTSTSLRISQTSNGDLDNVNLDDENTATTKPLTKAVGEKTPADHHESSSPTNSHNDKTHSSSFNPKTLSLSSITQALPSMPWSPPANESPTKKNPPPLGHHPVIPPPSNFAPPVGPSRKLTSPFSWLSRNTSKEAAPPASSPPAMTSPRRNTASSDATLASNPEMMLSRLEGEKHGGEANGHGSRSSLKDRFKLVRLREEAGITLPTDDDKTSSPAARSAGLGILSPASAHAHDDKESTLSGHNLSALPPNSPVPTSPNPSLAPGTASGVEAGPSAISDVSVDWDLWQSVVYEGPAAVARTSPEELNRAIATGIPAVIRGVVWQVLAQSKNDDLELVYRELVARGTDKDKDRHSGSSLGTASNSSNLSAPRETASSASSVHSAADVNGGGGGGSPEKDNKEHKEAAEAALKAHQAVMAERKKREKEDKAALQRLEKVIRKDLGARTSYSKFAAAQGMQESLFNVCKAYALFDEGVGYAQGMNFLIMPLLFNMGEEEAFCLLVRLMNHYQLRDLYVHDMPGLHKALYQFERLVEDLEPALYCHLRRKGVSSHLYATQWFLTLFAYRFPLQLVLRIYDLILSEGLSAVLRFGVVLMQKNAAHLLGLSDLSALTTFLRDRLFDVYIDSAPSAGGLLENGFFGSSSSSMDKEVYRADQMVRDACEVRITPELLASYTEEWEEKVAAERHREQELSRRDAEIEELRGVNHASAVKVRRLEEQLQVHDAEQAEMATQLVHLKVENQELRDESDSLQEQTRALRQLLQDQPGEIEKGWAEERDALMETNQRVHEENKRVEQAMADLEAQLVQTKMQYAEINENYESLKRKWTDMRKQFDT